MLQAHIDGMITYGVDATDWHDKDLHGLRESVRLVLFPGRSIAAPELIWTLAWPGHRLDPKQVVPLRVSPRGRRKPAPNRSALTCCGLISLNGSLNRQVSDRRLAPLLPSFMLSRPVV